VTAAGAGLRWRVLALGLLLIPACTSPSPRPPEEPATSRQPRDRYSVYALEDVWTDQSGRERTLASLTGRVQVVAMVYTHCHHTCPQIVADLKRIEAQTEDADFVLVSLDPVRDTPAQLRSFAEGLRLDSGRWTLLVGSDESTRALSALLGVRYQVAEDREIAHTNPLVVLDRDGAIVHIRTALEQDLGATLEAIRRS
jgi:protein SCO1